MRRARAALLVPCLAAAVIRAAPAGGIGKAEKGDASIEAIGSVRLTAAYLHYPDVTMFFPPDDEGIAATEARLILEGDLGPRLRYDVNLFAAFSHVPDSALAGAFETAGAASTPYRTRYLAWDFWDSGSTDGRLGVDRLALTLEVDRVVLALGRFTVNWSVAEILAPNDFFAPFTPVAINTEWKPGVDAIRLAVTTGALSSVEVAGVLGNGTDSVPAWGRSAVLVRIATVLWGFEWALLGGKVAERWIAGCSFQGEAGPIGLRGEAHAGFPDASGDGRLDDVDRDGAWRDDIHGRLSAGVDLNLPWQNLSLATEYMFLSDGVGRASGYLGRLARLFPDDQPFLGRHYVALSAGVDIIPILRLDTLGLFNATDFSGLAAVILSYSIADEADAVLGVLLPWGDEPLYQSGPPVYGPSIESEFGLLPLMFFAETRFYF